MKTMSTKNSVNHPLMIKIDLSNKHQFEIPPHEILQKCFETVAAHQNLARAFISIEIASANEIQQLNKTYRKQNKPTNILSFPFKGLTGLPNQTPLECFLGDIVICPEILQNEAKTQQKRLEHHWCHLLIHGILHLLGYDHACDNTATEMEQVEILLLEKMNIDNPYIEK